MKMILILALCLYFNVTPPERNRPSDGVFDSVKIIRISDHDFIVDHYYFTLIKAITHNMYRPVC